ncbi:DMT family transporter [Bradyrhizobium sp. SZCCHNR2031]|nr:EamA family transporter [Bradyrhizobium sp. SZCCHNR2031]
MSKRALLFLLMSLIWGSHWIAIKIGVASVPPVFLAAARYLVTAIILVIVIPGAWKPFSPKMLTRTVCTGLLAIVGSFALLFWGMQYVDSGVSALINLSVVPIGLFGLTVAFGQEAPTLRHVICLAIGICGLFALFAGRASFSLANNEIMGAASILAGTLLYCLGSVLSRPLLTDCSPMQLSAAHAVVGAIGLGLISLSTEAISGHTFRNVIQPAPIFAIGFLVIFGTIAYAIYLSLVRDWGASAAGLYAFVSPVVALILGSIIFGEPIGAAKLAGAALLLLAAAIATNRALAPRHLCGFAKQQISGLRKSA